MATSFLTAQYGGGTLYFTSPGVAIFFNAVGASYGVATGGSSSSITVNSINYTLLSFTSDGNLVVSRAGLFDVLMFGGGGGGSAGIKGDKGDQGSTGATGSAGTNGVDGVSEWATESLRELDAGLPVADGGGVGEGGARGIERAAFSVGEHDQSEPG